MAFGDFQYPAVVQQFGLTWHTASDLFAGVQGVAPSPHVQQTTAVVSQLATIVNTEKARSEWMIAPILGDLWARYRGQISLFSGVDFQADPAARLNGFCDFLIARAPQQPQIIAPVMVIFEAKKENINDGLGQCIAGMVGAQRFNQRTNAPVDSVYGCVTSGTAWKFLRVTASTLVYDLIEYEFAQVDRILGILTHVVGPPPAQVAA
ncbi:hypothetical protein [Frigoriglobus tundricola]|uniref:Uncharacterized protein n=1 Tax=Frigoriglobus tundricola TaxID=2774151 RepID=A0A6M5YPF5_9BACT|nr:hypothetical protein [Frigoriglobus tundricola]QJW95947.1 hypothetical protein FTUN_3501 [Frigoriglobus tundricola]